MKKAMALALALTILTACDYAARRDVRAERDDGDYRAAMEDYRAGRIDAAIKGFEKAIRRDPANASARFQLACLQQDVRHDWLEAYCGYREYLLQQSGSDKASLAKDRLARCEKELAKVLATKYGLNDAETAGRELASVRRDLKAAEARIAQSEKVLGDSQARVRQLVAERDRLVRVIKGGDVAEQGAAPAKPSADEVKSLLEEDDEEAVAAAPSAAEIDSLRKEADEDGASAAPSATEIAALRKETDEEDRKTSEILVPRLAATNRAEIVRTPPPPPKKTGYPPHPSTYVVQEGDTLYSVAKRFYGTISVWKTIRNANKTRISMDNRLRAGDTLVLP